MILITGGAGFIGSNIAAHLSEHGERVVVCDRWGDGDKWRNVSKLNLEDIVAPEEIIWWIERHKTSLKAVIHMGAISSTTETDVDLILRENYRTSRNLWDASITANLPFIYASSAATYGDGAAGFDDDNSLEALAKSRPLNPYGWSKLLFDQFVANQCQQRQKTPPQFAGLRFFNVYGPNEYHKGSMKSVVAHMFPHAAAGETVTLFRSHNPAYTDGGQKRDFIYVRDCCEVVSWLIRSPKISGLFNVGTGQARTFLDLANALFAALNRKASIKFIDTPEALREKYQYFTQANMSRLIAAGYSKPFTSLEDGIAAYVHDHLATPDPYR